MLKAKEAERALADNDKLVHYVLRKRFPAYAEDEDMQQACRIALWQACLRHDPAKGRLSTFAVACIDGAAKRELCHRAKLERFGDVSSLDEPVHADGGNEDGATTLADFLCTEEDGYLAVEYALDLEALGNRFPGRHMEMFRLSLRGYSDAEVGRAFGVSRARANKILLGVRRAARELLIGD